MDAKHFIPGFFSATLEFFADENYKTLAEDNNEEEEEELTRKKQPAKVVSRRSKDHTIMEYKRFAFKIFELLIKNCFDQVFFSEISDVNESGNQLSDLLHNMDVDTTSTNFSQKTTVSKIFSLLLYTISTRFSESRKLIFEIFRIIFEKIKKLGLNNSPLFNANLCLYYKTATQIMKTENKLENYNEHIMESF